MYFGAVVCGLFALVGAGLLVWALRTARRERERILLVPAAVGLVMALGMSGAAYAMARLGQEIARTSVDRDRAVACVARIVGQEDLSALVNDDRVYRLDLQVSGPGGAEYRAVSTAAVGALDLGRMGAGRTRYHCLADRDDPKQVEILWERTIG
ncbi:hypothetical protein ABZ801_02470 [Actinomadura sp. NPDC047616]|uniref:hypothetical protein n=1 Tax=Actinomadura sp. NPDC047616 TaxID=3155914 RepID=UPI0033E31E68